ncbi:hypothetical protein KP509_19G069700 [Ceratopteris richardii]|uniref:ZF-HD dimerization-type domain-containing protein n=1 Tax=Ceratopteris richardii TaxID=49495 RepID=A0A8T2SNC0_CERRI|nr:hypothetical protein KP509_19G069700 [Ceratopteris richardii]KAH7352917.1 hypothetical protein KP509_19G069700 [Ceratopteris richardii]
MDHDYMLPYNASHFSAVEPVVFHGVSGFSSAEEDLSSDASQQNPAIVSSLASETGFLPIENEHDKYCMSFVTEDFSNNDNHGGALRDPLTNYPLRVGMQKSPIADKSIMSKDKSPHPGSVSYRECMKNHAVSTGGHAVDGCGEFLACGDDGFDALTCSVCGCHRNFHRREVEGEHSCSCKYYNTMMYASVKGVSPPCAPELLTMSDSRDPMLHSQENFGVSPCRPAGEVLISSSCRKRRQRTKFTFEQKERMLTFAEHIGWRIVRQNDHSVQQFCDEIGVERSVFKVWMHNNKNNQGKKMNTGEIITSRNYESSCDY